MDELREVNFLHASFTESLRLYPLVAIDTQSCRNGDIMSDRTFVGKDWFLSYSAYAMGRMESIWVCVWGGGGVGGAEGIVWIISRKDGWIMEFSGEQIANFFDVGNF